MYLSITKIGPNFKKQSMWLKIGFARVLLIFRSGGEHHLVTMVAIPPTNLYIVNNLTMIQLSIGIAMRRNYMALT